MGLVVTIGCPGAGKSLWASGLSDTTLRMERDRFRECIFGSRRAYHEHYTERSQRSAVITQAMLSAMIYWPTLDWALTDTGLEEAAVRPFLDHARRTHSSVQLIVFERKLALLRNRNETRPEEHRIPAELLEQCYEKFYDPNAWWRSDNYSKLFL